MSIRTILSCSALWVLAACGGEAAPEKPKTQTKGPAVVAEQPKPAAADQPATDPASVAAPAPAEAANAPSPPTAVPAPPDVAAPPADAEKTASGLASKMLSPGKGNEKPHGWDKVKVQYSGWTTDGHMFDSSVARGQTAELSLTSVIRGWTEGMQLMRVGEKRRFWIPEALAYQGQPGRPAGMLVFDIELVEITRMPAPPPVPEDVAAPPANAERMKSGLATRLLAKGSSGERAKMKDVVKIHYTGWTNDGQLFDSSISRGEPLVFPLAQATKGWQEAVPLMTVGEKRRFWMPAQLAFGEAGGPNKAIVLDVELVEIVKMPAPPPTPADVKGPPADAKKTASGLAYKVLKKGAGTRHPKAGSTVKVHYSGWTTDGKLFDSSLARGEPAEFPLDSVIPGWTEGVQLLAEGDKARFWIPESLAYKGQGAGPKGMLVFEVELLKIVKD